MRRPLLVALLGWGMLQGAWAQDAAGPAPTPRLGLVLSGGGARGLAHVGVLKVLEREHIPIDLIAGTSMGAIIGGLYASGMSAAELEHELLPLAWDRVFASRVERQQLSQRRKEEDFEFSPIIELGMRDGEFRAPQSTLSSRGLEILLRRYTLPVRTVKVFTDLPTPFKAVSTDMESGSQVVMERGDLALALRSSMSVPGLFAPTEWQGRILGDGGLVNNLPVDVARQMGATQLIAVNVGTPLAARETLSSLVGVTSQMINILTEQNVQRSIASLWPEDVLITPELGKLTSADFDRSRDLIRQGERAAEALLPRLRALALTPEAYAQWLSTRKRPGPEQSARLAAVVFEGSELTHPERFAKQLETQPGQAFDTARAERDARLLASSGDYERVDYHVEPRPEGDTLVFAMEDKPWGPNYFRIGLDLSTDFAGESSFNLRISHNRHWLTDKATEWRNQLSLGQTPRLYSELYQPLGFKLGRSNDWFLSGWSELERRTITIYDEDSGKAQAKLGRTGLSVGADIGQPWSSLGEIRLGVVHQNWRITPDLVTGTLDDVRINQVWHEWGLRLKATVDQLDFANFPQNGYRVALEATAGHQSGPGVDNDFFHRIELQATRVQSWGRHTLSLHTRLLDAMQNEDSAQGPYTLGGFQQLSGYQPGQLSGSALFFTRASYYLRLRETPVLTRGFFVGGTLEAGNAWDRRGDASLRDLRYASSLFVGADTGLGPLYLALGYAPRGGTSVYLFIGRP